jgi:hypothetical protein
MADTGGHDFVPKKMTISVWGMDASYRPFIENMTTANIARRAVEFDTERILRVGEILGAGVNGMKSRLRVVSSRLFTKNTYRVQMEDLGQVCMWEKELANPDGPVAEMKERRRHQRFPVRGSALLHNRDRSSHSRARLVDISRGGYYVETLAPLPPGSVAEITLECHELAVDTTGKVCTSHPSIGMGVEIQGFRSAEDEQRFQELIAAVEQGLGA